MKVHMLKLWRNQMQKSYEKKERNEDYEYI
jgi:hypothetical protein